MAVVITFDTHTVAREHKNHYTLMFTLSITKLLDCILVYFTVCQHCLQLAVQNGALAIVNLSICMAHTGIVIK